MSRTIRWIALLLSLGTVSVVAGFGAAVVVLVVLNTILPPFQPSDDDTLREFVPAALAYLAWGTGGLATALLGWRRIRRYR